LQSAFAILRLRAGTVTLLIGPRASAGNFGGRLGLDSEAEIQRRLIQALQEPESSAALRRFWAHWQGDAHLSRITDRSIIDRVARMAVRGPLIVLVVTDTSVHRRDNAGDRRNQVGQALRTQARSQRWTGPVTPPAPVTVSATATPAPISPPAIVSQAGVAFPPRPVAAWSIAEKLNVIVVRAASSERLSADARAQLQGMLSDPQFLAWLIGSLLVWFVAQFFVVGEIFDMLLAGAALVLSGAGIFFALKSLVDAAHLIGQFVEATRSARDDKDLDAAADILAQIIVMIGITVLIAALTHATSRATSTGMKASSIRKPPPERPAPVEKVQPRPEETVTSKVPAKSESTDSLPKKAETSFDERVKALSYNAEQKAIDIPQGQAAARYEQQVGRTVELGTTDGVDIVDPVNGPMSVKGPLGISKKGDSVPVTEKMVDGLGKSVVKDVKNNTATKNVVVDLTGLTRAQQESVIQRVGSELGPTPPKTIEYIR
jgi:hypothetical protein